MDKQVQFFKTKNMTGLRPRLSDGTDLPVKHKAFDWIPECQKTKVKLKNIPSRFAYSFGDWSHGESPGIILAACVYDLCHIRTKPGVAFYPTSLGQWQSHSLFQSQLPLNTSQ